MQAADVYSLGAVLWEMWCGCEPWEELYGHRLYQALVEEKRTLPIEEEHVDIAELLREMFNYPNERPSAKQVQCIKSSTYCTVIELVVAERQ